MSNLTRGDLRNLAIGSVDDYLKDNEHACAEYTRERLTNQGISEDDIDVVISMLPLLEVNSGNKKEDLRYA